MRRKVVRLSTTEERVEGVKEITSLQDLTPDDHNFNDGTERGAYMVDQSLETNGAGRSILADRRGKVIAGNKTLEAAAARGLKVRVIRTRGDELIVHQREDLDMDDDPEFRAHKMALDDNRASEVGLKWNAAAMVEVGLPLDHAFYAEEQAELLVEALSSQDKTNGAGGEDEETDAELDTLIKRATEWQAEFGVAAGQLWQLGRHRLLVGDCRDQAAREELLRGERPALGNLDPPYGINIVAEKNEAGQLVHTGKVGGSKPFGATSGTKRASSTGFDSDKKKPRRTGSVQRGPRSPNQIIQSNTYPVMEGDDKPFDPSWLIGKYEHGKRV
jgi:hypothetical protein